MEFKAQPISVELFASLVIDQVGVSSSGLIDFLLTLVDDWSNISLCPRELLPRRTLEPS